jgi:LmbE family N-acetylglucosaminyl deacetylase
VCGDPTVRFTRHRMNHPDHRAVAQSRCKSFPDAPDLPELLEGGFSPQGQSVFIHGSEKPDTFIDIRVPRREAAALRSTGQMGT